MKVYFESLLKLLDEAESKFSEDYETILKKLSGAKLEAGAKCSWCYEGDMEFLKKCERSTHPMNWFYYGFIVPLPDSDGRGELEPEQCIVCVLGYPMEKENPEVDWTPLITILTGPQLKRFHVMEIIRPQKIIDISRVPKGGID